MMARRRFIQQQSPSRRLRVYDGSICLKDLDLQLPAARQGTGADLARLSVVVCDTPASWHAA